MIRQTRKCQHLEVIVTVGNGTVSIFKYMLLNCQIKVGVRSEPAFFQRYLSFFMPSLTNFGTCWLILSCSLWEVQLTYWQLQQHTYYTHCFVKLLFIVTLSTTRVSSLPYSDIKTISTITWTANSDTFSSLPHSDVNF